VGKLPIPEILPQNISGFCLQENLRLQTHSASFQLWIISEFNRMITLYTPPVYSMES